MWSNRAEWIHYSSVMSLVILLLLSPVGGCMGEASSVNFESGHVRPLVLSPDHQLLFAVNTPDNRLEIFRVMPEGLVSIGEVVVGLEPVAIAAASATELYVVNHLSDSVSVVDASDPTQPFVRATLRVGDEPRDIVLAGVAREQLLVSTAHRGQNRPESPPFTTPGMGRADVWVFDRHHLAASPHLITLFCDTPRALAVSADGTRVYAAAFHSGNQTTVLHAYATNAHARNNRHIDDGFTGLGMPAPTHNTAGIAAPDQAIIVKFQDNKWVDAANRDWTPRMRFNLPDQDVFELDTTQMPPIHTRTFTGVGTILFNLTVHPISGAVYVSNLESRNHIRFEAELRGHMTESRVTILTDGVQPVHLNPHIDYHQPSGPPAEIEPSLAFPMQLVFTPDGTTLYLAAFGSGRVASLDATGAVTGRIAVGNGPSGLALDSDRERLYVMNRLDHTISIVDTATATEWQTVPLRYNPESAPIRAGRARFYDARQSSGHGDSACASCHIFGDVDSLAWDLGDPNGRVETNPLPPARVPGAGPLGDFHPMKGPMATQSLRGLVGAGAMHWRGDRNGGANAPDDEHAAFMAFRPAFQSLLGRATAMSEAEMAQLRDFVFSIQYPPNPIAAIDGTLTEWQQAGQVRFESIAIHGTELRCTSCHVLPIGTDGSGAVESLPQDMKIPHLRNLYQKVGMFGYAVPSVIRDTPPTITLEPTPTPHLGDQVRGFGYEHDGATPTLKNFLRVPTGQFAFPDEPDQTGEQQVAALAAYLLTFDTGLAPVVGQQVTLTASNLSTTLPRFETLRARADAGDCDLVVHGRHQQMPQSWLYVNGGFRTDRRDVVLSLDAFNEAFRAGATLTATAVPPGSGQRLGLDRDEDGGFNQDEIDAGTNPADPSERPNP